MPLPLSSTYECRILRSAITLPLFKNGGQRSDIQSIHTSRKSIKKTPETPKNTTWHNYWWFQQWQHQWIITSVINRSMIIRAYKPVRRKAYVSRRVFKMRTITDCFRTFVNVWSNCSRKTPSRRMLPCISLGASGRLLKICMMGQTSENSSDRSGNHIPVSLWALTVLFQNAVNSESTT